MKMPKPQQYLDGLIGSFNFNPVEFFNLKPAEQRKYLLEAVKLSVTKEKLSEMLGADVSAFPVDWERHALEVVADVRKVFYDRRTVANATVSSKSKAIDELKAKIPEGFTPREASEEQISKLRDVLKTEEIESVKRAENDKKIQSLSLQVADIDEEVKRL